MYESGTFVQIQFIWRWLEILTLYLCFIKLKQSKQGYKTISVYFIVLSVVNNLDKSIGY